jgi:hypothetical protein
MVGLLFMQGHATAENVFSIHSGSAFAQTHGLRVAQPGLGTGLVLHDAEWGVRPFTPAPYYGVRVTHVNQRYSNWSATLDFSRYNIYDRNGRIQADGIRYDASAANGFSAFDRYAQYVGVSRGMNVLSLNTVYRWRDTRDPRIPGFRWEPYVGAGLSHYWRRADDAGVGLRESGQQASGFAYQLMGGVRFRMTERLGAFVEAKFSGGGYADGQMDIAPRNFHAMAGVGFKF